LSAGRGHVRIRLRRRQLNTSRPPIFS
jgi:hypothetical protein